MNDAAPAGAWREVAQSGRLGMLVLLCLGVWLHAGDMLVTATLMPAVVGDIGGLAYINWTIALYQVGSVIAGAVGAALSRKVGLRRMLLGAAVLYGLGCVANALTPDMAVMLAARLVQGLGGGVMLTLSYVSVQSLFPERLWTRLMAVVSAIWGAASLAGPLIGGVFADFGAWRGAFWFFAAQAAVLAVLALTRLRDIPEDTRPARGWSWPPLALLTVATLLVAEAGVAPGRAASVACGVAGLALLLVAARADARAAHRLLPTGLLDVRRRLGAGVAMVFLLSAAATPFWAYGPVILKAAFGIDPVVAGTILAAELVLWTLATMATSGVPDRWQPALVRIAVGVIALGEGGFVAFVPTGSLTGMIACALLQGAGFGMCWPSVVRRLVNAAPAGERDLAAATSGTVQRIGYAVGAAATGIAANAAGLADGADTATARRAAFWVFAAFLPVIAAGAAGAWRFTAETRRRAEAA